MMRLSRSVLPVWLLVMLSFPALSSAETVRRYQATPLAPLLAGRTFDVSAVSSAGQIAGVLTGADAGTAFLLSNGRVTVFGDIDHEIYRVLGVNINGNIVGLYHDAVGLYGAFMSQAGTIVEFGARAPDHPVLVPVAIDDEDRVAGFTNTQTETSAWLFDQGQFSALGTLGADTTPAAIAGNAVIVGQSILPSGHGHAFRYEGAIHDLGTLGGENSAASAVNRHGDVVGWASLEGNHRNHACIWSGDTLRDLGTLAHGANSQASAINNSGEVIGWSDWGQSPVAEGLITHAFIANSGGILPLDWLIEWPSSDHPQITELGGIDNLGNIVARAGTEWYLLRPTTLERSELTNFSVLAVPELGEGKVIIGAVLAGDPHRLLVRAVGPTLANFGVANPSREPMLHVIQAGRSFDAGGADGAITTEMRALEQQSGAFPLPALGADAALVAPLGSGVMNILASSRAGDAGPILAELYAPTSDDAFRILNVSGRARIGNGRTVTFGFSIAGAARKNVLLRAIGPTLDRFGVIEPLAAPQILLRDSEGRVIRQVQNWDLPPSPRFPQLPGNLFLPELFKLSGAFDLPVQSGDAATFISLAPGCYTVEIKNQVTTQGIVLVELYDLDVNLP